MNAQELPSTKPYLIRAIWQWCSDHGFTPYLSVQVDEWTRVPREAVRDGQIVLNVGMEATNKLDMGNDVIEFQARFNGVARDISIPIYAVVAIYARENGAGMAFEVEKPPANRREAAEEAEGEGGLTPENGAPKKGNHLQRVK